MIHSSTSTGRRWAVLLPALFLPFVASFFYFVLFPGTAFGNSFYSGIKVFLLVWPFLAVLLILKEKMIEPGETKQHLASLLPGVGFGLLVVTVLVVLLKATPLAALIDENSPRIAARIHDLGVADHFLWFAIFISFAHAALEEFYWRWFVFRQSLKLMPVAVAYVVAAVGFASHHIVILSQFFPLGWALALGACVGIGGAVWCWIYRRHHSLLGPWASHMIIDLGLMWVGWEVLQAVK
jgi:uncharacterized protein